ncbi:MAG: hypothetical protein Q9222_002772 [Ikaeria aurantiellina]
MAKHARQPESPPLEAAPAKKQKKRLAFSTYPKASIKAITVRNASNSPLLRLPTELRMRIWTEVLGERLVHLKYKCMDEEMDSRDHDINYIFCFGRSPWRNLVCEDDGPEDAPKRKYTPNPRYYCAIPGAKDLWVYPHHDCKLDHEDVGGSTSPEYRDYEALSLTILRVSRQMYTEANPILWTTNTFAFPDSLTLQRFMMTRTIHQKRLIRNLRLQMVWDSCRVKFWSKALSMPLVKSLTGLRTLRLNITYQMENWLWHAMKDTFLESTEYTEGLRKLSMLPLTSAEVAFHVLDYVGEDGLWEKADRNECARKLRDLLLNPKGAEVYAEHQRLLKECAARNREMEARRASQGWASMP